MAIAIRNQQKKVKIDLRQIRRRVQKLLRLVDCREKEISLLFVDDEEIQEINQRYLGRNYPTNVISFSLSEGEFSSVNPDVLGDIVISVDTASRDAERGNIPVSDELDFLIIHGLLHILGYNHENNNPEETACMQKKEQELFFLLHGYPLDF
ncbi:rRNA maturation RNase YbeY [Syntrophus aciditrophicus]|nr:rRNA maturation RNase YbeY [Syntrophus aciditrophicus]OPY19086.1 MAG: Endoribonuclease YbeY [Syntrophus sp. PtaB.Bin075]